MTIDLAAVLAPHVNLAVRPNWQTFARPGYFAAVGVMLHHTAGRNDLNTVIAGRPPRPGDPGLPGPLANLYSDRDAPFTITLISGGRCNHAGAGAARVLAEVQVDIAPAGDAIQRGLSDGPVGNGFFYGIEAENLGDGVQPWPPQQLEAIAHACAALCRAHGWTANRVIAHKEWSRRKPDPRGFSMASMRARVAQLLTTQEDDDMTPDQAAKLNAIADAVGRLEVTVRDPNSGIAKTVAEMKVQLDALAAKQGG